jgi:magnesium-transporting ATPase (P-type)
MAKSHISALVVSTEERIQAYGKTIQESEEAFFFQWLLNSGYTVDEARNGTLLLMVLFENVHVFNSRSETRSTFRHSPLRNPLLLFGAAAAQLVHIGAMYAPWISDVLHIQPVSPQYWLELLGMALTVLLAMEIHKTVRRRFGFDAKNGA